jgi:ferredoxin-NADP reductase
MARAAVRRRLSWQVATVTAVRDETATCRTLVLDVPDWPGHLAGQHVDIRLTAPDGYRASRSYSIAAASPALELTVETLDDGEVSPYLTQVLAPGDPLEIRGPVGGWFVWRPGQPGPVQLVGGGSGVVPLMCMLRHRRRTMPQLPMRLVYSVRHADDVIYADELGDDALLTFTREPPDDWTGHRGRIDSTLIGEAGIDGGLAFVCGSNGFVESASQLLLEAGYEPHRVRTERFGPTG